MIKKLWPKNAETASTVAALVKIRTAIARASPGGSGEAQSGEPDEKDTGSSTPALPEPRKKTQRRARKTPGGKKPKGRKA
jgi:hypothetical protein